MLYEQLLEFLMKEVNRKISPKMKMQFEGNVEGYHLLRAEIEERVMLSTNWLAYFPENISFEIEIENLKTLNNSSLLTLHKILIETLKRLVDMNQEKTPLGSSLCAFVLDIYHNTKTELESRFADFPRGNGFLDFLEARGLREGKANARVTGSTCIFCGSSVRSNGDKWKCKSKTCGKQFRKRS